MGKKRKEDKQPASWVKTYGQNRHCANKKCNVPLSVYNSERFCWPCQRKIVFGKLQVKEEEVI